MPSIFPDSPSSLPLTPARKREWNRHPITDLFPRIPPGCLERIMDLCQLKDFSYNLSESKAQNARHYSCLAIAHVRHHHSDYDRLLREEGLDRHEARARTGERVWKVLKEWCPWEESNEGLRRCFEASLKRRGERGAEWDPMDVDSDEEVADAGGGEPMDLD